MKNLLVVCLILSLATLSFAQPSTPESFMPAEQFGNSPREWFFQWSTSAGRYILRHDGLGEFTSPQGLRRRLLVRMVPKGRFERVYYLEHERDLFLLCKISGHGFFLVRMEQTIRTDNKPNMTSVKLTKIRWSTPLGNLSGEDPSINGDVIRVGTIEVSKASGRILKQE